MKKTLFFLLFSLTLSVFAMGQTTEILMRGSDGAVVDTVSNTGTGYVQARVLIPTDLVGIQAVLEKLSGSTQGTVKLFGSIDGTNFTQISSDTLAATDAASQSKIFFVPSPIVPFYRVVFEGAGTHSTVLSAIALSIKK